MRRERGSPSGCGSNQRRLRADFFRPADGRLAGLMAPAPTARSRFAFLRVAADTEPFFGGGSFTPSRRASERPIATACRRDFALPLPCFSSRICSRTNSPACVPGFFPVRASARALFLAAALGMTLLSLTSPGVFSPALGSGGWLVAGACAQRAGFTSMLFFTSVTPLTVRAISPARLF